jgi:hypothetical protein
MRAREARCGAADGVEEVDCCLDTGGEGMRLEPHSLNNLSYLEQEKNVPGRKILGEKGS